MKGLLLKDFYMTAKYCRSFLLIVIVFLAVSFFGKDNIFFILYPVLISSMIPVTLISYDEHDKWNVYSLTLPYTRGQLVSAKYLTGLIFGAAAYVVSLAATIVRMQLNGYFSLDSFLGMAVILLALGMLAPTLLLPLVFKLGANKGRIAFYIMIGLMTAAGALAAGIGMQFSLPAGGIWLLAGIVLMILLLYVLSWRLSIVFYRRREM